MFTNYTNLTEKAVTKLSIGFLTNCRAECARKDYGMGMGTITTIYSHLRIPPSTRRIISS